MKHKYIAAANNSTATVTRDDGSTISTAGRPLEKVGFDVRLFRIIVGIPVASANITVFNKDTAYATDAADIAAKYTFGSDIAPADTSYSYERIIDFGPKGLLLNGGNVMCDQACQLTVIYGDETDL